MQPFSSFRDLIDKWDEAMLVEAKKKEAKNNKVKSLIDGQNLIMFFRKGSSIFGTPEEGRIVFARMKNPDDQEMPDSWADDANFAAHDLIQALRGNNTENLFSMKDLPDIEIITRDDAENSLMQCPDQDTPINLQPIPMSKNGIGVIKIKDGK